MNIITRFITINFATSKIEPLRLVDTRMVDTLAHSLIHTSHQHSYSKDTHTHTHTTVQKHHVHPRSSTHKKKTVSDGLFFLFRFYFSLQCFNCFSLFYLYLGLGFSFLPGVGMCQGIGGRERREENDWQ